MARVTEDAPPAPRKPEPRATVEYVDETPERPSYPEPDVRETLPRASAERREWEEKRAASAEELIEQPAEPMSEDAVVDGPTAMTRLLERIADPATKAVDTSHLAEAVKHLAEASAILRTQVGKIL